MILSFKKKFPWGKPTNFEEKILKRVKIHTMREDKRGRWKPDVLIHLANGVRTKFYNCFLELVCVSVQYVKILHYHDRYGYPDVFIDGKQLSDPQIDELAKNDGFDSTEDFFKWFNDHFYGKLIHWTDLKY
jgi:hypothetical protein